MTDHHIDQAVRKIVSGGVSLRPVTDDGADPVGHLDDGTALVRDESLLPVGPTGFGASLKCRFVGHRFDGRRNVTWDREETPAVQCSRCDLVRARRPTGAEVE